MKIILSNRDIPYEYVKACNKGHMHFTEDIHDAHNFTCVEEAEMLRAEVQDATGNAWEVLIIED